MALKIANKIYLSWDDIDDLVNKLCLQIQDSKLPINSIMGIKRGGLIPAVMVSHRLNIPYVESINANTLVIDDICDTGETLKGLVQGVPTAVLHYKLHTSVFTPSIFAEIHKGDEWLIYPWERRDSEAIQDYLKK
jgi:hypoxanthine phosphoribosyltransferase